MTTAYLSLGSNLGDRIANLQVCIERLNRLGEISSVSSFYETEPLEVRDQPWFVNCVVALNTNLKANQLLSGIQMIEAELGRNRVIAKGPRTIDIDIVLFGSLILRESSLQVPHPAMHLRRFVLVPLVEVAPEAIHPVLGNSARELLLLLEDQSAAVKRLAT